MDRFKELIAMIEEAEKTGYLNEFERVVVVARTLVDFNDYPLVVLMARKGIELSDRDFLIDKFTEINSGFIYMIESVGDYETGAVTLWTSQKV